MDLQVTIVDPNTGVVRLGIPPVPRILSGLPKLTQIVTLQVLRDPGRDVLSPEQGAGFRAMIGQYNFITGDEIRAAVIQRVRAIEQQLFAAQPAGVGTPEERLKSLRAEDVAFDEVTREVMIRLRLVNEAGGEADILV